MAISTLQRLRLTFHPVLNLHIRHILKMLECIISQANQNGTLTLAASTITMKRNAIIRVQSGGKLIIDGGQLNEANVLVEDGGSFTINNGGVVRIQDNVECFKLN